MLGKRQRSADESIQPTKRRKLNEHDTDMPAACDVCDRDECTCSETETESDSETEDE